ncbi:MAG: FtsX-like permease family protein [Acidimicrobiales bacterium]
MSLATYRLRTVARHRWRSYLGIAALIGVVGGIGLFAVAGARRTQSAYPRFLRSVNASTLAIDPGGLSLESANAVLEEVAKRPEVVQTRTYVSFNLGEVVDGKPNVDHGFEALASIDGRYFDQDRFTPTSGRLPDPARHDEIAVNEHAAEMYGYTIGQVLHVGTYSDEQVQDPNFFDNPSPPKLSDDVTIVGIGLFLEEVVQDDYDRSNLVLFTPAFTAAHIEYGTYTWQGLILRNGDADIDAIKTAYVGKLDPGSPQFFRTTSIDEFHALQSMRPTSIALAIFGLIALFAALLLGGQAIARQLRFERNERDAWRALGAPPGAAVLTALLPLVLTVLIGALLAGVLAVLASPAMPIGAVGRVEINPGIDADWAVLGFGALVLVGGLASVAAFVAWREAPQRVAARGERAQRSRVVGLAAQSGMSPSAVAGLRLAFEPGQGPTAVPVRSVIVSVAVAVAALVAALTFSSSIDALVSRPALYGWDWGATIWANGGYGNIDTEGTAKVLGADPNVEAWSQVWFGSAIVDQRNLPLLGMDPSSKVVPPIVKGRQTHSPDEVVLGTATIEALHKHIGDTVTIGTAPDDKQLTIVGTAVLPTIGVVHGEHTSLGVGAVVVPALVPGSSRNINAVNNAGGNTVFVKLKPGTDAEAEIAALQAQQEQIGGGFQDITVAAVERPAEIVNASDASSSPALLAGALVLAAAISLTLALVSSVRRRRRDLALLKSLGFTRRQVGAAVAWQATATAVVAVIVGVPAGILLGRWTWIVFAQQLDVVPRPRIPLLAIAALVIAAIVLANLVATIPARVARAVRPALVLRGD